MERVIVRDRLRLQAEAPQRGVRVRGGLGQVVNLPWPRSYARYVPPSISELYGVMAGLRESV